MRTTPLFAAAAAALVSACAGTMGAGGPAAVAQLAPTTGNTTIGEVRFTQMAPGKVRVRGEVRGLRPGVEHGFHVHEKGDCSAVDATSAGAHFNPAGSAHGRAGTATHHAGDMDNIVADASGVAKVNVHLRGVTLGGGAANDIANRAVIVHAAADDYHTQPTGNAGARVACGVIKVTR